jgi:hypothetical protein
MYKKIILVLTLIAIACSNLTACNDTTDKIAEPSEENNYETDKEESQYNNIWSDFDFFILTNYPNRYDGAPIGGGYERDKTGEMSISEMLAVLDNIGNSFLPFDLETVQGLYLEFSFNTNITPAEIKNIYYIKGNNETEIHYLDSLMKVPEEIGVYNFFANLEWTDGSEETVYFRVEVAESLQ